MCVRRHSGQQLLALLHRSQTAHARVDTDRAITLLDPHLPHVGYPAAIRPALGVANIVTELRRFTADIALTSHSPILDNNIGRQTLGRPVGSKQHPLMIPQESRLGKT